MTTRSIREILASINTRLKQTQPGQRGNLSRTQLAFDFFGVFDDATIRRNALNFRYNTPTTSDPVGIWGESFWG